MKKILITFLLILLSPVIIIACFALYFELIQPIQWSIQYYPNRERSCTERADPVRAKINDVQLSIPADYYGAIPRRCNPSGTDCVKVQKLKKFGENNSGQSIKGYCQSKEDPPFYGGATLWFARNGSKGTAMKLSADGQPDRIEYLQRLTIRGRDSYAMRKLCNRSKSNYSVLNTPVILNCKTPHKTYPDELRCRFEFLIGKDVAVSARVSTPKEYYSSYFQEIEKLLLTLLDEKPEPSYDKFCSKYKD